ncbi:hypothetical protein [Nakamurella lactea]|uniref:hypothetical protein n=1 Tax=Nakamurella lactea TaxID=459515 RepID=UPI0012B5E45B|nr:hypothetical protein [Nakamurella lactea]
MSNHDGDDSPLVSQIQRAFDEVDLPPELEDRIRRTAATTFENRDNSHRRAVGRWKVISVAAAVTALAAAGTVLALRVLPSDRPANTLPNPTHITESPVNPTTLNACGLALHDFHILGPDDATVRFNDTQVPTKPSTFELRNVSQGTFRAFTQSADILYLDPADRHVVGMSPQDAMGVTNTNLRPGDNITVRFVPTPLTCSAIDANERGKMLSDGTYPVYLRVESFAGINADGPKETYLMPAVAQVKDGWSVLSHST